MGDVRESPSLEIIEMLNHRGARISYSDPHVPSLAVGDLLLRNQELTLEALREADAVAVITNHRDFDMALVAREAKLVIDTRNATRQHATGDNVRFL